jgi:hypothetical protein
MLGVSAGTAEEFHSWCRVAASTLRDASIAYAADGQVVSAIADAWASDVAAMQAVIWGRLVIGSHSPQRVFFETAEPIADAVASGAPLPDPITAADVVEQSRTGAVSAFTPELASAVEAAWPDVEYLRDLPAPGAEMLRMWTRDRLGGQTPERFITHRRQLASERMVDAQLSRMKGDTNAAVTAAYEADYRTLEAYLIESCLACGDVTLMSACSRFDLVSAALSNLPSLPDDFLKAALTIRHLIAQALGEADGSRFERALLDLQRVG